MLLLSLVRLGLILAGLVVANATSFTGVQLIVTTMVIMFGTFFVIEAVEEKLIQVFNK